MPTPTRAMPARTMLNKVPEVTVLFWAIKVMATTVGETAADFISGNLKMGLTNTTLLMAGLFAIVLFVQFRLRRYVPAVYWLTVVFISVVGTLITDNLTDNLGVSLWISTGVFLVAMCATFATWYAVERTLSIHTIVTTRREAFYWSAILFTFALGTAAGDLISEQLNLGYARSILLFGGLIVAVVVARVGFGLNEVAAFWMAYILTRPLGASVGDYLTASRSDGGLGLGTNAVSAVFLICIVGIVVYFTIDQRRTELEPAAA
jgi:uncharacterized membrane-anchored protein